MFGCSETLDVAVCGESCEDGARLDFRVGPGAAKMLGCWGGRKFAEAVGDLVSDHDQGEDRGPDLAFGVLAHDGGPGDVGHGFGVAGLDEGEGLLFWQSAQDVDVLVIERTAFAAQAFLSELV